MDRILLAVDFSDFTPHLLQQGARLARALDAEVYVVHVEAPDPEFVGFDVGPQTRRDDVAGHMRQHHRDVQALADQLGTAGVRATALLVQGPTVEKILGEADRLHADVIVMGTQGHGRLHRLLLGSVGEGVLGQARCPVFFVPVPRADQA